MICLSGKNVAQQHKVSRHAFLHPNTHLELSRPPPRPGGEERASCSNGLIPLLDIVTDALRLILASIVGTAKLAAFPIRNLVAGAKP